MKIKLKQYKPRKIISILLLIISAGVLFVLSIPKEKAAIGNGVLDLKDWEENDGILQLDGQWDFYWKQFLDYRELIAERPEPDLQVALPKPWNHYRLNGKRLSGYGYASYVLRIHNTPVGKPLMIKMPVVLASYELYVDQELLISQGTVGGSKEECRPELKSREAAITPSQSDFIIIVHVSNYSFGKGGMCYLPTLEFVSQMQRADKIITDLDLFLIGALIIMAFYYLCIFLYNRKDTGRIFVAVTLLLLAAQTAISGDFLIYRIAPGISIRTILIVNNLVACWFPICTARVIKMLYQRDQTEKRLMAVLYGVSIGITVAILLLPVSTYSYLSDIIQVPAITACIYSFCILLWAYMTGKKYALITLGSGFLIILLVVHDILFQSNASRLGSLVYLFVHTFFFAFRYSEAYDNVETLSHKLLKLDALKDEFLANTSHELCTPLNGILGITEAMLRDGVES